MRWLTVCCVGILFSGCAGTDAKAGVGITSSSGAVDPTSLDPYESKPNVKVVGSATLKWTLLNGTSEKPESAATLVHLTGAFKSSHHAKDGVALVAIIPASALDAAPTCDAKSADARAYFRPRDGTGSSFGNLTGDYPAGWYHVVVVADQPGSFAITFDSEKELKPRIIPARDPLVTAAGFKAVTGARENAQSLEGSGVAWAAWATHVIGTNNQLFVDGGRTQTVALAGDCAKQTNTSASPTGGGSGGGGASSRTLHTWALGTGPLEAKGTYQPTQPAAAPAQTLLSAGWVAFAALEAAPAAAA